MELILASESARRGELLARLGVVFSVEAAGVDELRAASDPRLLPIANAERKASEVAGRHPGALVLGADTIILFNGRVIGKPRDKDDAAAILHALSGNTHEVITGLALLSPENGIHELWSESSEVHFKPLDTSLIRRYLATVPVLDKAGAYAIQEHGDWIVREYTGELENIIGLPLESLRRQLLRFGILPRG